MDTNLIKKIAVALVVIGGLNWGLFAFGYNLVEMLLGTVAGGAIATVVYVLVALSALYVAYDEFVGQ